MDLKSDARETESLWDQMTSMFEGRSSSGTPLKRDETALALDNEEAASYQQDEDLALLRAHQDQSEIERQEQERSLATGNDALAIMGRINVLSSDYMRLEATLSELIQRNKELGDDWNYYTNDLQDELTGLQQRQDISVKMEAIRSQGLKIQSQMKEILSELESYGVQIPKSGGKRPNTKRRKNRRKKKTKRRRI